MNSASREDDFHALSERAAAGDRAALDELLVRHLPRLRAFVRLRAGPLARAHDDTGDLVQSVCREVLAKADVFRFASEGAFRQWLFTEALRKLGKRARYEGAEKRDVRRARELDDQLVACYSSFTSPSEHAARREFIARVETAFDRLTEPQREVVTLAYLAGMSRAEIAAQLDTTEGAVRTMLHRALARIAALLDETQ